MDYGRNSIFIDHCQFAHVLIDVVATLLEKLKNTYLRNKPFSFSLVWMILSLLLGPKFYSWIFYHLLIVFTLLFLKKRVSTRPLILLKAFLLLWMMHTHQSSSIKVVPTTTRMLIECAHFVMELATRLIFVIRNMGISTSTKTNHSLM